MHCHPSYFGYLVVKLVKGSAEDVAEAVRDAPGAINDVVHAETQVVMTVYRAEQDPRDASPHATGLHCDSESRARKMFPSGWWLSERTSITQLSSRATDWECRAR